jgi:catechol 2,3-dioxygenase-like lactoylglutathione lyase family enzyme
MSAKLDHVGHVVYNFDEGMDLYKNKFGLTPNNIMEFSEFGSKMAFFPFGGIELELIQPGGKGKDPAARCLKARGEGLFHLSLLVDDYDKEIKKWRDKGFTIEEYSHSTPNQKVKVAFLSPEETKGLWIEFLHTETIKEDLP